MLFIARLKEHRSAPVLRLFKLALVFAQGVAKGQLRGGRILMLVPPT
jgi:hypothetical protein